MALTDRYTRHLLRGYRVVGERVTGAKDVRAQPVAAAAENGLLKVVRGRHVEEFLDELTAFPHAAHDDCFDALSGAHRQLADRGSGRLTTYVPRGRIPVRGATTRRRLPADFGEPNPPRAAPLAALRKGGILRSQVRLEVEARSSATGEGS